jgi:hypothetical protein
LIVLSHVAFRRVDIAKVLERLFEVANANSAPMRFKLCKNLPDLIGSVGKGIM